MKESLRRQADHIVKKLDRIECRIRRPAGRSVVPFRFSAAEIEIMAEMEHARWCEERIRAGWRLGSSRNVGRKISPYLVPWSELSQDVREMDRQLVRVIPDILGRAGLEIERAK